jgi:hypothetical protein
MPLVETSIQSHLPTVESCDPISLFNATLATLFRD